MFPILFVDQYERVEPATIFVCFWGGKEVRFVEKSESMDELLGEGLLCIRNNFKLRRPSLKTRRIQKHSNKMKTRRERKQKKNRSNYNIGFWSDEEHENFMRGFKKYGRRWVMIAKEFVTTRSRTQIASHAQKFFQKEKKSRRKSHK